MAVSGYGEKGWVWASQGVLVIVVGVARMMMSFRHDNRKPLYKHCEQCTQQFSVSDSDSDRDPRLPGEAERGEARQGKGDAS
jgi:hypothetical protein